MTVDDYKKYDWTLDEFNQEFPKMVEHSWMVMEQMCKALEAIYPGAEMKYAPRIISLRWKMEENYLAIHFRYETGNRIQGKLVVGWQLEDENGDTPLDEENKPMAFRGETFEVGKEEAIKYIVDTIKTVITNELTESYIYGVVPEICMLGD